MKCQKHMLAPYKCRRNATETRVTSKGIKIHLCKKCDDIFGELIEMKGLKK